MAVLEPVAKLHPKSPSEEPLVGGLTHRYSELWRSTPSGVPVLGVVQGRRRQRANSRATGALIDRVAARVENCPDGEDERERWREEMREEVSRFGEERFGWPSGYRNLVCGEEFFDTSVAFTRAARAFDPSLETEGLFQALRNVWIMNSLQMLLEMPVELSPSIFAYSMLYPLTDNLLDDPAIGGRQKREFCRRLGLRLRGGALVPSSRREADVYRLVGEIEGEFPRASHPDVWRSLLAIHAGQVKSLGQQGSDLPDLVATSVEKGGSSVLADGYLTAGELTPEEADFSFGYGVFLQFLDDLQDAAEDAEAGHMTVFSSLVGREPLDRQAGRLYAFLGRVLDGQRGFSGRRYEDLADLIRRNCVGLFVGAVAENPGLFTRGFLRALENRWPLRFRAMRRLKKRARKRFEKTGERMRRRYGVASVFELLERETG